MFHGYSLAVVVCQSELCGFILIALVGEFLVNEHEQAIQEIELYGFTLPWVMAKWSLGKPALAKKVPVRGLVMLTKRAKNTLCTCDLHHCSCV